MKRILAIALSLIMVLAALTGCMSPQKPSGDEGEQNPSGKRLPIVMTIAETLPSCVAFEYWHSDSIADLAELFQTSNHNISVRLSRTREKLRKHLIQEGVSL